MKIFEHVEQSTADNISLDTPGTWISITNDDAANSMTFDLDGNSLSSPITVKNGETYSNYFNSFNTVTITNGSGCPIRVDIGR